MKTKFSEKKDTRVLATCRKILFFYASSLGSQLNMRKLEELRIVMSSKEWGKLFENLMWRDCVKNKVIMAHNGSFPIETEISDLKKYFGKEINSITPELLKEIEFDKNHKHGDKVLLDELPNGRTFCPTGDHTNFYTKVCPTKGLVARATCEDTLGKEFEFDPQTYVWYLDISY